MKYIFKYIVNILKNKNIYTVLRRMKFLIQSFECKIIITVLMYSIFGSYSEMPTSQLQCEYEL